MAADRASRAAGYEDVLAAPPDQVAEVIGGVLYQSPRPAIAHAAAASSLVGRLDAPFKRGDGGPGGWVILFEPELHLAGDILVPDVASWRREHLAELPDAAFIDVSPDWVCEILSPSTQALDRGRKLGVYAARGVTHVWLVEVRAKLLEVLRLDGDTYRIVATATGDLPARLEPFEAIEFPVSTLWDR